MRGGGHRLVSYRLVSGGWALALGLSLAATAFAGEAAGNFSGGPVLLRPWMLGYNAALGALQLLALGLFVAGALRLPPGAAQKLSVWFFALAAGAVAISVAFPSLWSAGPWAPDGFEVRLMRVLVFAPSALRAAGCAALAVAILGRRAWLVVALLAIDLMLVGWSWVATEKAVMVCVHPYCVAPLGLVPWSAASLLFFWLLLSRRASRP